MMDAERVLRRFLAEEDIGRQTRWSERLVRDVQQGLLRWHRRLHHLSLSLNRVVEDAAKRLRDEPEQKTTLSRVMARGEEYLNQLDGVAQELIRLDKLSARYFEIETRTSVTEKDFQFALIVIEKDLDKESLFSGVEHAVAALQAALLEPDLAVKAWGAVQDLLEWGKDFTRDVDRVEKALES